jgi:murein tripeptide amidase MpaA
VTAAPARAGPPSGTPGTFPQVPPRPRVLVGMTRRLLSISSLVALVLLAPAAPASAEQLLSETVTAPSAEARTCIERTLSAGPSVRTAGFRSPATGWLTARLKADGGDWDLAVFERGSGYRAAGSASFGATEVAQGVVLAGREYVVQACRRSGDAAQAHVTVGLETFAAGETAAKLQMVRISTPTRDRVDALADLDLDLVEHHGEGHRLAVLHGPEDAKALRDAGFQFVVEVEDLIAQSAAHRRTEARAAEAGSVDGLPSGQDTYRRLPDYEQHLKDLVEQHPGLVKPFTLPHRSHEGRAVEGIEIATDVHAEDGRPAFLMMGLHHAREWPSGEHAIEWAYELLNGFKAGDARATNLLRNSRTLVVPVVNPDGFNASREAGERYGHGDGDPEEDVLVAVLTRPEEYRRKNCRNPSPGDGGRCLVPGLGLAENGVDLNRNYGGFWGGPGTSSDQTNLTYHGPEPFSEPETRNVRDLFLKRPIALHITNHTFSNLWLRPPGVASQGLAPDEELYKAIGDAAAAENGYQSLLSYQLYDTTGSTEDWTYWTAGSLGYTPEIGCEKFGEQPGDCAVGAFHPVFERTVNEWTGDTEFARGAKPGGGGGNREAYYLSHEAALDRRSHSRLEGSAPAGATLRLTKTHETPTSRQGVTFEDAFEHTTKVGPDGRFAWHVNPSTRPLVAQERGREAQGDPSPPVEMSGSAGPTNQPCADYDTTDDNCFDDHPFEVPANGGGVDNASMTVRMQWGSQASDWDLKVFRDVNENGVSDAGDELVGSSGQFPTDFEETTVAGDQFAPGKYVARAINYAAIDPYTITVSFAGPEPYRASQTEAWTLVCEVGGEVRSSQQVVVARGESRALDLAACGERAATPAAGGAASGGGGAGGPGNPAAGDAGSRDASCTPVNGFRSVDLRPRSAGARVTFARAVSRPVTVDVFQQSSGRSITGERLVARYRDRTAGFVWNGRANRPGRTVRDGYYIVRWRMELADGRADVRRVAVRRVNGRLSKRASYYRRATCGLLRSYKLTRPVFGGRTSRALYASFQLERAARVTVTVLRGNRVIRRMGPTQRRAGLTHRVRIDPARLPRGDYRVLVTAVDGAGRRVSATLTSRRL